MKKSLLALLLVAVMMLGLFAGCSKEPTPTTGDAPATTDTPATTEPTEEPVEEPTEDPADEPEEPVEEPTETPEESVEEPVESVTYPLVTDGTTFTVWWPNELTNMGVEDYNERFWFQHMEELTGVHLDFSASPSTNAANEQYNLMLVSGDVSDFVYKVGTYHLKGLDNAVEEGWYYDMIEYLDYMPNMSKVMFEVEERALQAITDSGYLAGLPMLVTQPQDWVNGPMIRKDWLDKYNMEVPTTIDELEAFLEVTYANEPEASTGPLWMSNTCFTGLEAGYNIGTYDKFLVIDGEVQANVLQPGYKAYIEQLAEWNEKGLIFHDFASAAFPLGVASEPFARGGFAATWECFVYMNAQNMIVGQTVEGFELIPYAPPASEEGMTSHTLNSMDGRKVTYAHPGQLGISTNCENMEVACRYWDYGYSEEAHILANYGPEDETMYFDEQGNPHYTEFAMNPPEENWNFNGIQKYYMLLDAPFYRIGDREQHDITDAEKACGPAWTQGDSEYFLPNITTTADEGEELSSIMSDIKTYIEEQQALFVTGQRPLSEFEDFINTVKSMGIEDAEEIYQDALDRYNERATVIDSIRP